LLMMLLRASLTGSIVAVSEQEDAGPFSLIP
jgi:hypothetical protein